MSFAMSDMWIIVAIIGLAVIGFVVFRLRKNRDSRSSGRQFLWIGIIWVITGLGYGLWMGHNVFDIVLFNLGLVFTVAGSFQLLMEKYKKRGSK